MPKKAASQKTAAPDTGAPDAAASTPSASTYSSKPCPICSKPSAERFHPFCSKRCADVDLHRWLSGSYAIPGRPEEEEDGEAQGEG
ncbi:DNA gyrase inhibitor YacG [Xanthobacter oligotrophicus]|uniref:DNA gyrase inhibitor YacG n=1 Tax=Xanthobacter oligotrophicus TaxID=2607286 RepID=UPI0011F34210|nr:DNA gyrase inhibitor YacG [Xanthobacter oligotrophicus]MCG5236848.1 DNA gyrase inhibitor YacG [Xanthobacter oligotrophicus]